VVDALPTAGGPDSLMRSQNIGPVLDRSYLRRSDESRGRCAPQPSSAMATVLPLQYPAVA
jgi:hypothetical protein